MFIWNQDGLKIMRIVEAEFIASVELTVRGVALYNGTPLQWSAIVKPNGWSVTVRNGFSHREVSLDGATFNLPLEIAAAIRNNVGCW